MGSSDLRGVTSRGRLRLTISKGEYERTLEMRKTMEEN